MNKHAIIIDTDPGIDDAAALAIALFDPTIEVKLITTVAGNVSLDKVTDNALRLLQFFGKEVPVAKGAETPLIERFEDASNVHGLSGMEGYDFPPHDQHLLLDDHAIVAMRDVLLQADSPMTIVAIGPLTNVALLLQVYPAVKPMIKEIVFMGGSLTRGNKGVMSEFNIATDPEAAKIVFDSGLPMAMIGLDIGQKALILPEDCKKLADMGKAGEMLYSLFTKLRSGTITTGLRIYDAGAMAYLLQPSVYDIEQVHVDVELAGPLTRGTTVVDLRGYLKRPANMNVCTDVDSVAFRDWFLQALSLAE